MIFDRFFNEKSGRDLESLYAIKVALNSKQVNKDVRKDYYAASLFLDKVLDSYLILAAVDQLEIGYEDSQHVPIDAGNI